MLELQADGLAALVRPLFAVEPFGGHVFLFRSKNGNYLKALHWDGSGLCLFAKRLERGRFVWPPLIEGGVVLTPAQFALLIEAMDWRRTVAPDPPRLPSKPYLVARETAAWWYYYFEPAMGRSR